MKISQTVKITGGGVSDKTATNGGGVQLFRSWSHLDMASVLSGWYGYNLFNIANFIEYEPYPKRRKLELHKNASAAAAYHRGISGYELQNSDYELTHKEVKRVNSSLYRPYSEASKAKASKYGQQESAHHQADRRLDEGSEEEDSCEIEEVEQDADTRITIDNLYPEILCMIFKKLDIQSLGRAAQVFIFFLYM